MSPSTVKPPTTDWLAWARLMRISAVPTAATNVLMGYALANGSWSPWWQIVLLCCASCCFYASGMVLNDYADHERDASSSPNRPIPSGKISRSAAGRVYLLLSIAGLVMAGSASLESLAVGLLIVLAVFAYNVLLKTTPLAAPMMGICRMLNVLLGASTLITLDQAGLGLPQIVWYTAISLGVLITGLTVFARDERGVTNRGKLLFGSGLMGAALLGFAANAQWHQIIGFYESQTAALRFMVVLSLIALPVCWRVLTAVRNPEPATIQIAVMSVIRSLIFLDAVLCMLVIQNQLFYPLVILTFLIPSMVLSRWISST